MSKMDQKMYVASNCPGYDPINCGFVSSLGPCSGRSCDNCQNYNSDKCQISLYDDVLYTLGDR
jgi:hypothetical protein